MPEFVCENKKCKERGNVKSFSKVSIKLTIDGVICPEQICLKCGELMKGIRDKGFTKYVGGGENVCKK